MCWVRPSSKCQAYNAPAPEHRKQPRRTYRGATIHRACSAGERERGSPSPGPLISASAAGNKRKPVIVSGPEEGSSNEAGFRAFDLSYAWRPARRK
jgi:hypothetical protein